MGKQVETLEHHANTLANGIGIKTGKRDVFSVKEHFTIVDGFQQVQATQERALARTAGANESHHGSFGDIERNSIKHGVVPVGLH